MAVRFAKPMTLAMTGFRKMEAMLKMDIVGLPCLCGKFGFLVPSENMETIEFEIIPIASGLIFQIHVEVQGVHS